MTDEPRDEAYDTDSERGESGAAGEGDGGAEETPPDELLDLPLGGGAEREPEGRAGGGSLDPSLEEPGGPDDPSEEAARGAPEEPAEAVPEEPTGRRPDNRLPFLLLLAIGLLLLLAVAGVVGYLLPRPSPALVRAEPTVVEFGPRSVIAGDEERAVRELRIDSAGERPARIDRVEVGVAEITGADGVPEEGAARAFRVGSDACSGATVVPGDECVVAIAFDPSETGPVRGTLLVDGDFANAPLSVPLLGEGVAPRVAVAPERLDFGSRALGAEAVSRLVTVDNDGSASLALDGVLVEGAGSDDFRVAATGCTRSPIGPGESCALSVSFAPVREGERRANLRLRPSPAARGIEMPVVSLAGVGIAARMSGRLEIAGPADGSDGGIGFGAAIVGRGREQVVRLVNRSEEDLEIGDLGITGGEGAFSVASSDCPVGDALPGGGACEARIRFEPVSEEAIEGTLTVTGARGGERVDVTLRGRGTIPELVPSPAEVRFEESRVGREGGTREVLFASTGSGAVEVAGVEISGPDAGAFNVEEDGCSGGSLEPGEECRVEVGFRPRQEGLQSGRLRVRSPSLDRATEVPLDGAGAAARVDLAPGSLSFGQVRVTRGESLSLTVRSAGRAALEIARLDIAGADAGAFRVVEESCSEPLVLTPGETCRVTVRFAPAVDGAHRALLVIAHDGVGAPAQVELTGTGLPAPAPRLRVAPARLRFGSQAVGGRSAIETVTVYNEGSDRLVLDDIRLAGPDAADFRVVAGSCAGAPHVTRGSECTFGVRFVPSATGPRSAEIVLRHNAGGGEDRVEVEGTGSGG